METERKIPGISRIWANLPDGWTVSAVLIGLFVLSPIVSVV